MSELLKHRDHFSYFAPRCLKIRTKQGELQPFKLNAMQKKIDDTIERLRAEGKPARIIVLKARQLGTSTYTQGKLFHASIMNPLTSVMIVAHTADASSALFNISKLFYDELPSALKPMKKASNSKELVFENSTTDVKEKERLPGLRSRIRIATAGSEDAGRGSTIHHLHASEVAFWSDPEKTMLSLMQAVPNTEKTTVILESTANGVGGYFYEQWKRAMDGQSDFIPLFFAWHEDSSYRMSAPTDFELSPAEQELKDRYRLDNEQLMWRRWAIANNCGGDPSTFDQEYPHCPEVAFLTSGRPRFDNSTLMQYLAKCEDGQRGDLEEANGRVTFVPDGNGYLEVWTRPSGSKSYTIGADVAKGLVNGDYSVGAVYDADQNLCAMWHGHQDVDLFAENLRLLGNWYNEAQLAIEENNSGLSVINAIKDDYWNLYKRTTHDKVLDKQSEQLGWYTSEKTKKLAIDNLARLIREREVGIKSKRFIQECLTYVLDDTGKTNASAGSHDDTVMASAIALYVMQTSSFDVPGIDLPIAIPISENTVSHVHTPWSRDDNGRWVHESEVKQNPDDRWFSNW